MIYGRIALVERGMGGMPGYTKTACQSWLVTALSRARVGIKRNERKTKTGLTRG